VFFPVVLRLNHQVPTLDGRDDARVATAARIVATKDDHRRAPMRARAGVEFEAMKANPRDTVMGGLAFLAFGGVMALVGVLFGDTVAVAVTMISVVVILLWSAS